MKKGKTMEDDKIELRSEKVRQIIGEIPSGIVRYSIMIITVVVLVVLVGAYFIHYPEYINATIQMTNANQGTIAIPYKHVNTVEKKMEVRIELEGYDAEIYGIVHGIITTSSRIPQQTETGCVFTAQVMITDSRYKPIKGMTGRASILISNESVLQRIIRRMLKIQ